MVRIYLDSGNWFCQLVRGLEGNRLEDWEQNFSLL